MAVTNKKSKQKPGKKKSAKGRGRQASAQKDYIGGQSSKKSSRNSNRKGNLKNNTSSTNSRNSKSKARNSKAVNSREKNENRVINGEIIAIITLVLGVFFAVTMHTELTGIIGDFIGKFFRGMFGVVGYLIPYTMIISSFMVFLKREKPFTKKHMVCMVVIFFMINLINAERFMENFSLSNRDVAMVYSMGNNLVGGGILGMYPGKLIETAIGPVGIYLFSIAAIIIAVLVACDFSLAGMLHSVAERNQEAKARRKEEMEYYLEENQFEADMIPKDTQPEQVQENFFAEFETMKNEPKAIGKQRTLPRETVADRNADHISKNNIEKRRNMKEKLETNRRRHNILDLVKNEFFRGENNQQLDEILPVEGTPSLNETAKNITNTSPFNQKKTPTDGAEANPEKGEKDSSLDRLLERATIDDKTGEIMEDAPMEREHQELQINISGVDVNKKPEFNWHIDEDDYIDDDTEATPMMTIDDFNLDDEPTKTLVSEKTSEMISEKNALSNLENQIASNKSGTAVCGAVASSGDMSSETDAYPDKGDVQRNRKRSESKEERKEREKSELEIQANVDNKKEQANHYEVEYKLPDLSLLNDPPHKDKNDNDVENLRNNAMTLEKTLKSFNVDAKVINVTKGSSVTRYEVQPAVGTKVSSIVRLSDDIALNLRAKSIRMEAPIPGKAAVGIEIENETREMVTISEMIGSEEFKNSSSKLSFVVGKDIAGKTVVADMAKMPHMLIAGATGSGKSVCINTIITSILYHANPNEVKLVLIDPKMVELGNYNGIPHLLIPVVTDSNKAAAALNWAVSEMTGRYKKFAENSVREIKGYNKLMRKNGKPEEVMSQIVIVIDELADLMMVASSLVEEAICRLAQLARAAGIHLIVATQRPSVDVVTGLIKANIPSRIAFMVSSQVDSRTIIDMAGAEKLVGNGDMLFKPQNLDKPIRVQGPFISDEEVENIIQFIKAQNLEVDYDEKVIKEIKNKDKDEKSAADSEDVLMEDAIRTVIKAKQASVSMLQRRFRIGYNRAARIVDDMEMAGIVGPQDGSRPRTVLVDESYFDQPDEAIDELEENEVNLDQKVENNLED